MTAGVFRGLLWIDALSINQQDTLERSDQVNMMRLIFSQANGVLVWLGPEEDDSSRLLQFITTMPSLVYSQDQGPPRRFARYTKNATHLRDLRIIMPRPDYTIDALFQDLFTEKLEQAFVALFQRDYWKRLWIVQEVLLAEKLLVLCGDHICAWSTLGSISSELEYLGQIYGEDGLPIRSPVPVPYLQRLQSQVFGSRAYFILREGADSDRVQKRELGWRFSEVLQIWLHQNCEDQRDRVYGLLGLADAGITADYDKTLDQVYFDVIASERPRLSGSDLVVFVNALTRALYGDSSPEQLEYLGQMTGIDIENAVSYFMDFLPLPPWPSEEDYTAEPPIFLNSDGEDT